MRNSKCCKKQKRDFSYHDNNEDSDTKMQYGIPIACLKFLPGLLSRLFYSFTEPTPFLVFALTKSFPSRDVIMDRKGFSKSGSWYYETVIDLLCLELQNSTKNCQ